MSQTGAKSENELASRLKESIQERGDMFRLNVAHPSIEVGKVADRWVENGIATISDWGLTKKYDVELFTETDVPITDDVVGEEFGVEFGSGIIDWNALRDALAEKSYADEKNPKRHAGQAIGSIRRFVDAYNVGTVILGNFPEGQVPGVVTSDCHYQPENPVTDYDNYHIFVREVEWARKENGDPLVIPDEALPDALQPRRQSTTRVKEPQQLIAVARLMEVLLTE